MKVLEIKNNLVKVSYTGDDKLILSGFLIIEDEKSPYVAQVLSLKADNGTNYAIVKLLFTFDEEGIVKNYDGTIPSLDADVTKLSSDELLDILPVNTPIEIGSLANQDAVLKVDKSLLEQKLLICSENTDNTNTLLENFAFQLAEDNQKSIIFDIDGQFQGKKLKFGEDFKLPLNYDTINFIYEHDLENVDPASKAIIQDIFLEVQEYSKTVLDKFIPFDTFINVVDQQYQSTGLTELVLLKNKLLKYKEDNVFAQNAKEIHNLRSAIRANLTSILDISTATDTVQNEIMKYVFNSIDEMDLFVYAFVRFTNDNADKKLIRHFLTKDKIYTTIVCSHNYKYLYELKERANNLILFVPQTLQHDFATYNTFLNKLNNDEFIIYGKATQNIPLIIELNSILEEEQPEEEDTVEDSVEQNETEENENTEEVQEDKPDDFSDESNSYSFETLATDDILPVQEEKNEEPQPEEQEQSELVDEPTEPEATILQKEESEIVKNSESEPEEVKPVQPEIISTIIDEEIAAEPAPEIVEEKPQPEKQESAQTEDDEADFYPEAPELPDIQAEAVPQLEIIENTPVDDNISENFIEVSDELPMPVIEYQDDSLPIISDEELEQNSQDMPPITEDNAAEVVDQIMFSQPASEPSIEDEIAEEENLTEDDLNFIEDVNIGTTEINEEMNVPIFPVDTPVRDDAASFEQGDRVTHPKYGEGVVEKMIKYGNKTLCSINFANIGRRLLDPAISELEKVN